MARIRSLKPDYFDDEELAAVSPDRGVSRCCRILFAGLWCQADKRGRLQDRPARLKARLFPYDDDIRAEEIDEFLELLARGRFIVRYQVGDGRYIWIRSFEKHQPQNTREAESRLPPPPTNEQGHSPAETGEVPSPGAGIHPPKQGNAPAQAGEFPCQGAATHPPEQVNSAAEAGGVLVLGTGVRDQDLSLSAPAREEPPSEAAQEPSETDRAGAFVQWYAQEAYPRLRKRAYVLKPVRDFSNALPLVRAFADDTHLRRLAEFYLTCTHPDARKGSRTVGQFAALASWCDEQLAAGEARDPPETSAPSTPSAAFLAALHARVGRRDWFTWLKPCQVARDDGEALTLVAPTADHARYVSTHYAGELAQAGERSGRRVVMTSADEVAA